MRVCQGGCGTLLPPSKAGPERKWCSENCRKRTPEFRAAEREYNRTPGRRGYCRICGGLKGAGSPKGREICQACIARGKEAKYAEIQELWLAGATFPEITAELGMTQGYLGVTLHRMRREGWDVPYRYAKRVAA